MSRVAEFQAHAAADVALFEHGAAPRGAVDVNEHRFRAEDRVAGNQRLAGAAVLNGVSAVLGADFENRAGGEIAEMHAAFDLGLHDAAVDGVAQMRAWDEYGRLESRGPVAHGTTLILTQEAANPEQVSRATMLLGHRWCAGKDGKRVLGCHRSSPDGRLCRGVSAFR